MYSTKSFPFSPPSYLILLLAALCTSLSLGATNYPINSADDIEDLTLVPGDTVIWKNGTYTNQEVNFIRFFGTAEAPIVLKAETPGGVIFTGESPMKIYVTHLIVEGFYWREGIGTNNHVETRRSGSSTDLCTDCIIRDCAFDNLFTTAPDKSRWIVLRGQRNIVENCTFQNKNSTGVMILVELASQGETTADHIIRNNYFYNVTAKDDFTTNSGDSETIRIGSSGNQTVNARVTVEHNYFQSTDGENEIISNKSAENRYLHNTFRGSRGSLVLRHGARARVEGNFFLGEGKAKSGGIRVTDRDHVIVNNYMSGLVNDNDPWNNGITIVAGDAASGGNSNGYQRVDDIVIAFNTIYDAEDPIYFNDRHTHVSTGIIAHNLVYSTRGQLVGGDITDTGAGMTYVNNLFGGSPVGITNAGITVGDESFSSDGEIFLPVADGLVAGAAGDAYIDEVELDVRGLTRPATGRDIGAHEVDGASGSEQFRPIINDDVGNGVGVSYLDADGHSGVAANSLSVGGTNVFPAEGGSQSVNVTARNLDWAATADQDWISLSPSSGTENGVIQVTLTANLSSQERAGTITVAGMGLSREIAIRQVGTISPADCPQGTNVAVEGTISSFSTEQNADNAVTNVIDENNDNRWSAEGFPQFLVVDLGAAFSINEVSLTPHQERDYQFLLEGSNEPDGTFVTLVDATDNQAGGSSIDREFSEQVYRYIKLTVTGAATYDGPWVSISELRLGCSGTSVSSRNPAAEAAGILLRPVPVSDVLYIDHLPAGYTEYTLIDFTGRIAAQGKLNSDQIDLRQLPVTGIFVLRLAGDGQPVLTQKVMKVR